MKTFVTTALAGATLLAASLTSAQALPVQHDLGQSATITQVVGGCGPFRHPTPWGCRPNGWRGPGFGGPGFGRPGWHRPGRPGWHRR